MTSRPLRRPVPTLPTLCAAFALAVLAAACTRTDDARPVAATNASGGTTTASTDQTVQPKTPPPPGDSTPQPADSDTRAASSGTEAASRSPSSQSTVGSAASGAPPYTLNGAPEGNKAPKDGEPPKK